MLPVLSFNACRESFAKVQNRFQKCFIRHIVAGGLQCHCQPGYVSWLPIQLDELIQHGFSASQLRERSWISKRRELQFLSINSGHCDWAVPESPSLCVWRRTVLQLLLKYEVITRKIVTLLHRLCYQL